MTPVTVMSDMREERWVKVVEVVVRDNHLNVGGGHWERWRRMTIGHEQIRGGDEDTIKSPS